VFLAALRADAFDLHLIRIKTFLSEI